MRKQLELRWKQIDKFEASVKTLAEAKALWRKKLSAKEGEIEALQVREGYSSLPAGYIWTCFDVLTLTWVHVCRLLSS